MIDVKKFLDQEGIATLWSEISDNFIDVNELAAVINAIDKAKADKADIIDWSTYEFITIEDIDSIFDVNYIDPILENNNLHITSAYSTSNIDNNLYII